MNVPTRDEIYDMAYAKAFQTCMKNDWEVEKAIAEATKLAEKAVENMSEPDPRAIGRF